MNRKNNYSSLLNILTISSIGLTSALTLTSACENNPKTRLYWEE